MSDSDGTTDGTIRALHSTIDILTTRLAERAAEIKVRRETHPYSEVDMDMHVEAVTKELRAEVERLKKNRCQLLDDGRLLICKDHEEVQGLRAENARLQDENRKMNATLAKDAIEIYEKEQEIERLTAAIRNTASEGTYDENAIRKAVSFDLAELIVAARAYFTDLVPPRSSEKKGG
jgi:myosin heavy subunit